MDLAELTIDNARPLVGTSFGVPLANGGRTDLRLAQATGHGTASSATGNRAQGREPFSLIFVGERAVILSQGMYDIRSDTVRFDGIFLVPIGQDDQCTMYEAVFS